MLKRWPFTGKALEEGITKGNNNVQKALWGKKKLGPFSLVRWALPQKVPDGRSPIYRPKRTSFFLLTSHPKDREYFSPVRGLLFTRCRLPLHLARAVGFSCV